MSNANSLALGTLEETLNKVPFSLTLSDLAAPDTPLMYMNDAFKDMTGCTDAHLGQNCRFLQAGFDNEEARAEVRLAMSERRRTQVILKNRKMDGTPFSNLLLLDFVGDLDGSPDLALGAQFALSTKDEDELFSQQYNDVDRSIARVANTALKIRLERRRIAADSAVRLLRSWCILNNVSQQY